MAAITLPLKRDPFPESIPSVLKIVKVTYGSTANTGSTGALPLNDVDGSTAASTAATVVFTVPYGTMIYDIGWRVTVAFTDLVLLTVGSTADPDGLITAALLGATDAADVSILWASQSALASTSVVPGAAWTGGTHLLAIAESTMADMTTAATSFDILVHKAAVAENAGRMELYLMYAMPFLQSVSS